MPLEFTIRVPNMTQFESALRQVPIRDWSQAWPKVIGLLEGRELGMLASEGSVGTHGPWAELDPKYAERKARHYPGKTILRAADRLYESLRGKTGDTIDERFPERLRWGTSVPYALYHQTGFRTRLGTGKGKPKAVGRAFVPARRLFDFGPDDQKPLLTVFQQTANTIFRRLGFMVSGPGAAPGEARLAGRARLEEILGSGAPLSAQFGEAVPFPT